MVGITEIFGIFKNAGVDNKLPVGLKLRIKMINMICVFIIVTGFLMIAILNISGVHEKLQIEMELSLAFVLVILLNYLSFYNLSRIAFMVFTNAIMFYITVKDTSSLGNNFYFFLLPLGTLIVFDITEKIKIIICIMISIANYLVVYLFDFSQWITQNNNSAADASYLNYLHFFIYMSVIVLMSWFFVNGYRIINNELVNEQKRFNELERLAHVGSWRLNPPSPVIVASDELRKIFELDKENYPAITPKSFFSRIHPDDRRKVFESAQSVIDKGEFNEVSYRIAAPGKKIKYVTSRAMPVKNNEGRVEHVDGALINLTRQVEMQNSLAQNLKEKEFLLAEMHHRVKNNLAVISGLVQLQAFKVDEQYQMDFLETHGKINTIALIHEKFYQSESLTKINLVNFVRDLESQIARSIPVKDCKITTHFKIDDIYLGISYAIPSALILNELITNSYKHAFQGMKEGGIYIKIQKVDETFILHYKDNGIGMPNTIKFTDSKNQGLSLISMLAKSINYEFATYNEGGFYFTMFNAVNKKEEVKA